jgi:DNA (cytosine-5)-methyltransferase 1
MSLTYYEFFAGGGMARAGLGSRWTCLLANDFDPKKAASYSANWGSDHLKVRDVALLTTDDLPGQADLAWASFPCQDLSLAGVGVGLRGPRSGTFWPFWNLMEALRAEGRAPRTIVLENVYGAITSHGGKDLAAICSALAKERYRFGAMLVDAVHFVPQSRPRLFIVAIEQKLVPSAEIICETPDERWHAPALIGAYAKLPPRARDAWVWWRMPPPPARNTRFADLVDDEPEGVRWHSETETKRLLDLMSEVNLAKIAEAKRADRRMVGGVYRRMRPDGSGNKVQRAEVRFDDIAGCLRTPAGGSSRQFIMIVSRGEIRSRLLSPREAARLMGLSDDYVLPAAYNEAYHLVGDGVAVPVVRHITEHILEPVVVAAPGALEAA